VVVGDLKGMPDVVWPADAAQQLARRAGEMADAMVLQRAERAGLTDDARQDWQGKHRQTFDSTHEAHTQSVAQNLVENLYSLERVLHDIQNWVEQENAARRKARERAADDEEWWGLKKHWNAWTKDD
jgi:hypothetical protein